MPQNLHGATGARGFPVGLAAVAARVSGIGFESHFCFFGSIFLVHFWVHFLMLFWDPFGVQTSPWRGQVGAEKAPRRHQEAPKQQTGDTPKVLQIAIKTPLFGVSGLRLALVLAAFKQEQGPRRLQKTLPKRRPKREPKMKPKWDPKWVPEWEPNPSKYSSRRGAVRFFSKNNAPVEAPCVF